MAVKTLGETDTTLSSDVACLPHVNLTAAGLTADARCISHSFVICFILHTTASNFCMDYKAQNSIFSLYLLANERQY